MPICLLSHLNLEPREVEVREHAVVRVARIVEGKL